MQAPLLWGLLCALWAASLQFELQDMIRELQNENAMLHAKVENLTEVLMELKLYIWNHSRDWDSEPERVQELVLCKQDYGPNASSPGNLPAPGLVFAMLIVIGLLLKSAVNARAFIQDVN